MFYCFLKTFQSFHIKFLYCICFWCYSDNHLFKKTFSQLEVSAGSYLGLFWGLFWHLFLCFLGAFQSFLIKVCTDVFFYCSHGHCNKSFFTLLPSLLAGILGYFLVYFRVFISLMKFCTCILDNTLIVLRLKNDTGVLSFAGGYFKFLWGHFGYLSVFLEIVQYFFMNFCIYVLCFRFITSRRNSL